MLTLNKMATMRKLRMLSCSPSAILVKCFQRKSHFIQGLNCTNIGIFVKLNTGNELFFFVIKIRCNYKVGKRNNAEFGIVKAVLVSGNQERLRVMQHTDEEGIRITFKSYVSDAQCQNKLADSQCLIILTDRLCGLVVRVSGYRYRGLGFDSRRYQIF